MFNAIRFVSMRRLAIATTFSTTIQAAVIVNGGLNMLPGDEGVTISVLSGGGYNGWTNSSGVDIEFVGVSASVTPSTEGNGFVDLNGVSGLGSISQTITTDLSQIYRIDFSLSGNPGSLGDQLNSKPMSVLWNGISVGDFTFEHLVTDTHTNLRWEGNSVTVTGTGSDVLKFVSTGGYSDAGAMVDNVTITAIPEPSGLVLSGLGSAALFLRRRVRA